VHITISTAETYCRKYTLAYTARNAVYNSLKKSSYIKQMTEETVGGGIRRIVKSEAFPKRKMAFNPVN
jgi:hypothetical protein